MSVFIYLIIYFCWQITLFIKNAERIDHVSLLVKIADIVWTLQVTINNITISQQNEWPSIMDVH